MILNLMPRSQSQSHDSTAPSRDVIVDMSSRRFADRYKWRSHNVHNKHASRTSLSHFRFHILCLAPRRHSASQTCHGHHANSLPPRVPSSQLRAPERRNPSPSCLSVTSEQPHLRIRRQRKARAQRRRIHIPERLLLRQ
jgi:hypothetical protein